MNGKPKSYRAMLVAVAAANHPELDGVDKALLHAIAIHADYETGNNARPGNKTLQSATMLRWSQCHARIEKNIQRGLIECTYKAVARNKASVYRICLNHPAYPDRAPYGEWLISTPDPEPDTTVRSTPDSSQKEPSGIHRTVSAGTIRPETGNHTVESAEPSGAPAEPSSQVPEPSGLGRMTSNNASKDTSKNPPTTTPSAPVKPSGDGKVAGWIQKNLPTMGAPKTKDKATLEELISQHGEDVVYEVLKRFLNRPDGFGGLKHPWILFQNEAPTIVGQVFQEKREKEQQAAHQLVAGKQEREKALQPFAGNQFDGKPLTDEERAWLENIITNYDKLQGETPELDYWLNWSMASGYQSAGSYGETLSYWFRSRFRKKPKEEEEGGSIEDYMDLIGNKDQ